MESKVESSLSNGQAWLGDRAAVTIVKSAFSVPSDGGTSRAGEGGGGGGGRW